MAVSSSKIQDIHIEDKDVWAQFQTKYKAGDYTGAWQLIADTQFGNKKDVASIWNQIAADLVYVQGLDDPDFGSGKIRVATTIPDDIKDGEVWFQLTNEADGLITIQQCTSAANKTNDSLYPKTIATNVLGGSDMTTYPISPKNADAAISKLADGLYDVSMSKGTKTVWGVEDGGIFVNASPSMLFQTLAYAGGLYLASIGGGERAFYKSEDGLNFTKVEIGSFYPYNPFVLISGNGYFYCLGRSTSTGNTVSIYRSSDGETWIKQSDVGSSSYSYKLYYVNGYLMCCSSNTGAGTFLYSDDNGVTVKTVPFEPWGTGRENPPDDMGYISASNRYFCVIQNYDAFDNAGKVGYSSIYRADALISANWTLIGVYGGQYDKIATDDYNIEFYPSCNSASLTALVGNYPNDVSLIEKGYSYPIQTGGYYVDKWWTICRDASASLFKIFQSSSAGYEGVLIPNSDAMQFPADKILTMASNGIDVVYMKFMNQESTMSASRKISSKQQTTHTLTFTNAKGNTLLSAQID